MYYATVFFIFAIEPSGLKGAVSFTYYAGASLLAKVAPELKKKVQVMKTRVFERLKPKAVSFGFNEDELKTAAAYIAGSLAPEATDEMIDKAIDQFAPILGLSQNAAQRSFTRMKTQFEKDHPTPPQPTPPAPKEEPAAPEEEPKDEMPAWFKAYQSEKDRETRELKEQIDRMSREKANEGFRSKALAALKDVDENYYGLLLEGRRFESDDEVNSFVSKVNEGWNKLVQAKNIQTQKEVTPPGGGASPQDKPSQAILDRIAERGKIQETPPIKGLPQK